jgi:hypothetical protein
MDGGSSPRELSRAVAAPLPPWEQPVELPRATLPPPVAPGPPVEAWPPAVPGLPVRPRWASHLRRVVTGVALGLVVLLAFRVSAWEPTGHRPPPGREEQGHRLSVVQAPPPLSASYRFLRMQPDNRTPVTWSPCRPIHYVVRPDNAPPGGAELLSDSFARLSAATGLTFVDDGTTSERPDFDRPLYQPARYGKRWAPVLITWATPDEVPDFHGKIAGEAGARWARASSGKLVYVTGSIALKSGLFQQLQTEAGYQLSRSIVLHELGHLVGLAHVDDPTQIMTTTSAGQNGYQDGDLAGLAQLGSGPCRPDV